MIIKYTLPKFKYASKKCVFCVCHRLSCGKTISILSTSLKCINNFGWLCILVKIVWREDSFIHFPHWTPPTILIHWLQYLKSKSNITSGSKIWQGLYLSICMDILPGTFFCDLFKVNNIHATLKDSHHWKPEEQQIKLQAIIRTGRKQTNKQKNRTSLNRTSK